MEYPDFDWRARLLPVSVVFKNHLSYLRTAARY